MKTRIVVHIALNAKNQRVGSAVAASGRLISFGGYVGAEWPHCKADYWLEGFYETESVEYWKKHAKKSGAVRFQRVILEGNAA